MPNFRTEREWVDGDQSWLGSGHGLRNARTETLDISAFTKGTHYPNGYIPSGTTLAKVGGLMVPYNQAGTGGTEVLAGVLLTDLAIPAGSTEDRPIPVLDHGRIKTNLLPFAFTAPAAGKDATQFVYITATA